MQSTPPPSTTPDLPLPRRVGIGDRIVDLATYEVFVGADMRQRLTPKAFGVLRVLLENEGTPVHRDALISKVWPRQFPTDDVVTKAIRELRRALGDNDEQPVIATLPRIGYLLKLPAVALDESRAEGTTDLLTTDETMLAAAPAAASAAVPGQPPTGRRWWVWIVLAVLASAGLTGIALHSWLRAPALVAATPTAPTPTPRAFAPQLEVQPFTADPGDEGAADVSDDGMLVAFSSRRRGGAHYRVYVRSVDGLSERRLTITEADEDELQPVFAPDGHRVAYQVLDARKRCSLRLLDLNGGSARTLTDCAADLLVQMEFARDGSHLLVPRVGRFRVGAMGFLRLDLGSGKVEPLDYPADPDLPDVEGRYSPDGRALLIRRGASPDSQLLLHQVGSNQPAQPIAGIQGLVRGIAWLPDNRNVVFATDATGLMELWRLDVQTGFIERFGGVQGEFPSVAASDPVLVTRQVLRASSLLPVVIDGKQDLEPQPLFASNRSESWPAYAPDGRSLAFVSDRSGSSQIYLGDIAEGQVQQLSQLDGGKPFALNFSPDGRQIAFSLRTLDRSAVGLLDLDGRWTRLLDTGLEQPERLRFGADGRLWMEALAADGAGVRLHVMTDAAAKPTAITPGSCAGLLPHPASDGSVLFLGLQYGPLRRLDLSAATPVCNVFNEAISWTSMDAWTVQSSTVYAVLERDSAYALTELLQGGGIRLLDPLDGDLGSASGIAVRADGLEAVLSVPTDAQADLMLVRGF